MILIITSFSNHSVELVETTATKILQVKKVICLFLKRRHSCSHSVFVSSRIVIPTWFECCFWSDGIQAHTVFTVTVPTSFLWKIYHAIPKVFHSISSATNPFDQDEILLLLWPRQCQKEREAEFLFVSWWGNTFVFTFCSMLIVFFLLRSSFRPFFPIKTLQ